MGDVAVYTDGSCHPQAKLGAWAVIILIKDDVTELSGSVEQTTHNRMELTAVLEALKHLGKVSPSSTIVDVYSDSQYVCTLPGRRARIQKNDLLNRVGAPLPNADLLVRLFECLDRQSVRFIKVKAHERHQDGRQNWNRYVDKLARKTMRRALKRKRMLRD